MIDTTTTLAEWTVTGLNHHSQTPLFRLCRHRQPNCFSSSFARSTAPSASFYSRPMASSPPAPPDARLSKDSRLPSTHPPPSITISRPPAPGNIHSLPNPRNRSRTKVRGRHSNHLLFRNENSWHDRERKTKAYGRTFTGCGMQSDYEVMTKLGEGTFGYVFETFFVLDAASQHSPARFIKQIIRLQGVAVALKRVLMPHENRHANDRPTRD